MDEELKIIMLLLLKQNQSIIKQNRLLINRLDAINESLTYRHSIAYPKEEYSSIQKEVNDILKETEEIQQKLM